MNLSKIALVIIQVVSTLIINFIGFTKCADMLTETNSTSNNIGGIGLLILIGLDVIFVIVFVKWVQK